MDQPLTVDIQISKLVNLIIDSNIGKVGQVWVRAPGGGFLKANKTKSLKQTSTLFLPIGSVHPDINHSAWVAMVIKFQLVLHLLSTTDPCVFTSV